MTTGWVRLTLQPCPGVRPGTTAARLEVNGADRTLVFIAGRADGATIGVLGGTDALAATATQRFPLPVASGGARDLVLAPWPLPSTPPALSAVRLLAPER